MAAAVLVGSVLVFPSVDARGARLGQTPDVLQCAPSPLDLGGVVVGTEPANAALTCTNASPNRLTITSVLTSGVDAADFVPSAGACLITLVPGQSCGVTVAFNPGAVGPRMAVLEVAHARQGVAGPVLVPLRGTGIARDTTVSFEPTSLTFAEQLGLTTSSARTVTVTNVGSVTVDLGAVAIVDDPAGDFAISVSTCSGASLQPGASCQVSVTFTPQSAGARAASLQFDRDGAGTDLLPLRGTGATPLVVVDPTIGQAGAVITALGVGFPPTGTVSLAWAAPPSSVPGGFPEPALVVTPGADGRFVATLVVFPNSTEGSRTILATAGVFVAAGTFLVVPGTQQPPDFATRG